MKKYLAELIGTFALVFCGTGAIIINEQTNGAIGNLGIALSFGLVILVMVFTFGNISGAHFNPAVTITLWLTKLLNFKEVIPYLTSQLLGAFMATFILKFLFPENINLGATLPTGSLLQSFIFEFILTFFLLTVILNVTQSSKEISMFAAIAIGSTICLEAIFGGPISGASMNPARSISPAIFTGNTNQLWIYIFAPISGAIFAGYIWKSMKTERK
ncbi:MAG: MIP family channel protein [Bacteroidetes bacterium]|nr:MIP family channel protein [Bacteroidota bacterium]